MFMGFTFIKKKKQTQNSSLVLVFIFSLTIKTWKVLPQSFQKHIYRLLWGSRAKQDKLLLCQQEKKIFNYI